VTEHYALMVPGATAPGNVAVAAPYDDAPIATVDTADADVVDTALATAQRLFRDRAGWLSPHRRTEILERAAGIMAERAEHLAVEAAREGGKPLIDSRVEVARAIDGVKLCIETLRTQHGTEIPMNLNPASAGRMAMTRLEPIGVVVAVSAFNHPLNLIVHQVVPAIAVGCPVIVKPAQTTPLNCIRFVELVYEAGLPEEWCQCIVCDRKVAEKLVTDSRIHFFTFVGSAKVGWMLRSKMAPGVRCALEHGGVAPVIVDDTASLDTVIPSLLKGGFYHAGQVCVSVQRVFAAESIATDLAQQLAQGAEQLKVGDATKEDTEVGPLILPGEVERVHAWVTEAVDDGAQLLTGGKKLSDTTYAPTVLLNPPMDAKVSTLETFGPVVCVYAYKDRREAIDRANGLDLAFQAAVYTNDLEVARDTIKHLDASAVMVNDHTAFRVDWMPFAGRRTSGYGIGGIGYTMHDMVQHKMAVFK